MDIQHFQRIKKVLAANVHCAVSKATGRSRLIAVSRHLPYRYSLLSMTGSGKKRGYAGRRIGIGMDREVGTCSRCQLGVAVGLRGGKVGHLSPRGNMRLESLFCDVRSSPRYTLKTILIKNLVFLVENLSPKVL